MQGQMGSQGTGRVTSATPLPSPFPRAPRPSLSWPTPHLVPCSLSHTLGPANPRRPHPARSGNPPPSDSPPPSCRSASPPAVGGAPPQRS
eukprot:175235-Chlamydomonas_euryale.AAC.1